MAHLEHVNVTVEDPDATAMLFEDLFGWHVRWAGSSDGLSRSVHVGGAEFYVALYTGPDGVPRGKTDPTYRQKAGLNHIGIVVDDLDATEAAVKKRGFSTHSHADYEPGRRVYFRENNGVEIECISYQA